MFCGHLANPMLRTDEDRLNEFQLGRFQDALEGDLIAWVSDRNLHRRMLLRVRNQPMQFIVGVAADGGFSLKHGHSASSFELGREG